MPTRRLTVQQRKEIFRNLVATQDSGEMSVSQSLQHICQEYAISDEQIRQIQDEGIDKEWPPLNEEVLVS